MVDTIVHNLIDKRDNFEIIGEQIGLILANNVANQMTLASAEAKDPSLWDLKVYTERSNPWEQFLHEDADTTPIVNIWYDNGSFNKASGNVIERQKDDGVFNIDCYGFGKAENVVDGGHTPGDEKAALEAHRAVRLVRNIIMAATNTYLGLRGTVWGRWVRSRTFFQPQIDGRTVQQIVGGRIAFEVMFDEFAPQVDHSTTLEIIFAEVTRADDGAILAEAQYCYPLPKED